MLQLIHIHKTYKPKHGVPVKALDDISVQFPDKGMVFLLGKSGSGKSTLLNVLGGLDRAEEGEIIIQGVSSRTFRQKHFDSYRNTYLGFIFQEYNVLEDFTVGANIGLALELQGRKASDEKINEILEQVDLAGYGNRRPNELSGGQKQRVAIARALVKNPEIILADEPTGALDSKTGRQVLETLKKLSGDKLVIVVSHDREFAEAYADRIIELADGKILRDVERETTDEAGNESALRYEDDTITVPADYRLTEEDRAQINAYLEAYRSGGKLKVEALRAGTFRETGKKETAPEDGRDFRLIKSKLPLKTAFVMGASGMKHKRFRLVMTILLSCVAFTLFGLADTFGSYDHIEACTESILDTGVRYAAYMKEQKYYYAEREDEEESTNFYYYEKTMSDEDLAEIEALENQRAIGVYRPNAWGYLSLTDYYDPLKPLTEYRDIYSSYLYGYAEMTPDLLESLGAELLAGRLPDGSKDEIALSEMTYEVFHIAGFLSETSTPRASDAVYDDIQAPADLLGRKICLNGREYEIVGVVDTHFPVERYLSLLKPPTPGSVSDEALLMLLELQYREDDEHGLSSLAFVGEGFIQRVFYSEDTKYHSLTEERFQLIHQNGDTTWEADAGTLTTIKALPEELWNAIDWVDGPRTVLGEKEIILDRDLLYGFRETDSWYDYVEAPEDWKDYPTDFVLRYSNDYRQAAETIEGFRVVGYLPRDYYGQVPEGFWNFAIVSDSLYAYVIGQNRGVYSYALTKMPEKTSEVRRMVERSYDETADSRYHLNNAVTYQLEMVNEIIVVLAKGFLYVGIFFAIFASVMLANFIATSISYKKREIGILRAIGSRSMDVFRIFFSESFLIAMINFVLSSAGTLGITALVNYLIRTNTGILVTVLNSGIRQILLILVISVAVAWLASFFPVRKIAAKKPIDAIQNK